MLEVATAKMAFHQSTKEKGNNSFPESKRDYVVPSFITAVLVLGKSDTEIGILNPNSWPFEYI